MMYFRFLTGLYPSLIQGLPHFQGRILSVSPSVHPSISVCQSVYPSVSVSVCLSAIGRSCHSMLIDVLVLFTVWDPGMQQAIRHGGDGPCCFSHLAGPLGQNSSWKHTVYCSFLEREQLPMPTSLESTHSCLGSIESSG